jgi:hypothetical protein
MQLITPHEAKRLGLSDTTKCWKWCRGVRGDAMPGVRGWHMNVSEGRSSMDEQQEEYAALAPSFNPSRRDR